MAITETATCKIRTFTREGLGLGETLLGPIELPYTLPGELVAFERHTYRGQTNGVLQEILKPSPARVTPPCPYFGTCGGCLLQHVNIETHHRFKLGVLHDLLRERGLMNVPLDDLIVIPPNARRRAVFEVLKKNDQLFFGFHRFHSNQVINIDACLAIQPELSALISGLKMLFLAVLPTGAVGRIFVTHAENGIDMACVFEKPLRWTSDARTTIQNFAESHNVTRLTAVQNGQEEALFFKEAPYVIFGDCRVASDARGFLQASSAADVILTQLVQESAQGKTGPYLDLFCGRGTYTLPLSAHTPVHGVESDLAALDALMAAAQVARRPVTSAQRDLFQNPLTPEALAAYHFCVMNPPRAGAEAQSRMLAKSCVPTLTYVSCNAETFARDAQTLLKGGYHLTRLTPVDQFYWSAHLELVGIFERP